jgi:hypothetical protein
VRYWEKRDGGHW